MKCFQKDVKELVCDIDYQTDYIKQYEKRFILTT